MDIKTEILVYLKEKESVPGGDLSRLLGITRQALNRHLKQLIEEEKILKEGTTRNAAYRLSTPGKGKAIGRKYAKTLFLKGLEEDAVFSEIAAILNLKSSLSQNAFDIAGYAFTEMLNNAIDHSHSEKCTLEARLDQYRFSFSIRDRGVGIFHSVYSKFGLPDEHAAIGELLKGKTTTMEEKHSGEGIFFTSKSADSISFRSHKAELLFDNHKNDVYVKEKKHIEGTEVFFTISRQSKKKLAQVFTRFAPEEFDFRFEKTRVLVRLFHRDYVSRSEARRLLHRLDRFREIILDFAGVKSIGQGFADEIFRVFKKAHPHIEIKRENLSPTLDAMIRHVVDNKR